MADDTEKKPNEVENKPKVKLIKKKNDVPQASRESEKTPATGVQSSSTHGAGASAPAKAVEPKSNVATPERKKVVVVKKKSPAPQQQGKHEAPKNASASTHANGALANAASVESSAVNSQVKEAPAASKQRDGDGEQAAAQKPKPKPTSSAGCALASSPPSLKPMKASTPPRSAITAPTMVGKKPGASMKVL